MIDARIAIAMTIRKPEGFSLIGTGTFIPKKLAMTVGTAMMIVIAARNFITMF